MNLTCPRAETDVSPAKKWGSDHMDLKNGGQIIWT